MTGREKQALRKAFIKILSAAVVAAGLAGMYGMRSNGARPMEEKADFQAGEEKVIISQFYGAGGSEGVFSNDYVELYNPGDEAVRLDGYILSYSSGSDEGEAGSTVNSDGFRTEKTIDLAGSIPARGFYLVCGAYNQCTDGTCQIRSFNRAWRDLVIDDQPTVTLKLYRGTALADMVSTEGSSCRYLVSSRVSVVNEEVPRDRREGSGEGLRTFYWGDQVTREYERLYEPQSSYGAADGEE